MAAQASGLAATTKPRVVIAGGGVVGTATAYYLAKDHGVGATVVDRVGVAAAASGRAGGFLARHWNDGSPTEALTHASFDLHETLAADLKATVGAEVDYRRLRCEAVAVGGGAFAGRPSNAKLRNVEWVDAGKVVGHQQMGGEDAIAQVHPRKLCEALMAAATKLAGASFVTATAEGLSMSSETTTNGLRVDDGVLLEADAVILAMGPWTHVAGLPKAKTQCGLGGFGLALPPVVGTKYHAVLLQSPTVLSQAVFFQGRGDVEVYPRPDGEVYCTAYPEPAAIVEDLPGETAVLDSVCDKILGAVRDLSEGLREAPINAKQACHLPSVPDGAPLIGAIPGLANGFAAVGHGCWGILLAPATGKSLADAVVRAVGPSPLKQDTTTPAEGVVDLRPFDPSRFVRGR